MMTALVLLQFAAMQPAPEKLRSLDYGYSLYRDAHGCFLESSQQYDGTYTTFYWYDFGKVMLWMSNPAWKSLTDGTKELTLRSDDLDKKTTRSWASQARTLQLIINPRRTEGALAMNIGEQVFFDIFGGSVLRFSVRTQDGTSLGDAQDIMSLWAPMLRACIRQMKAEQVDPFAK